MITMLFSVILVQMEHTSIYIYIQLVLLDYYKQAYNQVIVELLV